MSALLDRLRKTAVTKVRIRGPKCTVCVLPAELLAAVRQLKTEGFRYSAIAATLSEEKEQRYHVRAGTLSRHFLDHES